MNSLYDTIAALATPLSSSGIGIIRVSGKDSLILVDKIFVGRKHLYDYNANTINYGHIVDCQKNVIDEVLVSVFHAPHSYTGEDSCEINCHGGLYVLKRVLNQVFSIGIRPAEAGEFSKRAFLNGRMDLAEAESVMNLISSGSEASYRNSIRQLTGFFSEKVKKLRSEILHSAAFIEAALDDPEHYDLGDFSDDLLKDIGVWNDEIESLSDTYRQGSLLNDGIETVISGRPNVGKSSLLNFLSGHDKAIVSDIPGTTRDVIEDRVVLGDIVLRLLDTAGIRETSDMIESLGVQKALKAQNEAELILYIIDSSMDLDESDKKFLSGFDPAKTIVILNKSDLESITDSDDICRFFTGRVVSISTVTGEGFDDLKNAVYSLFFDGNLDRDKFYITSEVNYNYLRDAAKSLNNVRDSIQCGLSEDFYTADLYDAYRSLGYIIGEEVEEDLVNKIFSDFCMGK